MGKYTRSAKAKVTGATARAMTKLGQTGVQRTLRGKEVKKKITPPKTKGDDTKKVQAEAVTGAARAERGPQKRVTAQIRERTLGDVKKVPGYRYETGHTKIANSDPVELGTRYSVKELKATEMAIKKLGGGQAKVAIETLRQAIKYRQGLKSATASSSARPMSKGETLREKFRRGGGKVVSRQGGGKTINEGSTRGPNPGELDGQSRIDQINYLEKVEKGGKPPKKIKKTTKKYGGGKIVYRSVSGKVLDGNELVAMIYKND